MRWTHPTIDGTGSNFDFSRAAGIVFAIAGLYVMVGALNKPVEYDEALTVLIAGGNGKVDWPNGIIPAVTAQDLLSRSDGIDALRYYRHFTR
jgi:hypothetical protein